MNYKKGSVLILSMLTFTILFTLGEAFLSRTINDIKMAETNLAQSQAFYLSEGGKNAALVELRSRVISEIGDQVRGALNITDYVTALQTGSLELLRDYANSGVGDVQFTMDHPGYGPAAGRAYLVVQRDDAGTGSYTALIEAFPDGDPSEVGDTFTFPYRYEISTDGTATLRNIGQSILSVGTFTVTIQRDNFARYALFTDVHKSPTGGTVWFTERTSFSGPVHTNDRFSFANNPSGTFTGAVTENEQNAQYYNSGRPVLLDADRNGDKDVPTFGQGFTRGVSDIAMPSTTDQQSQQKTALGLGEGDTIPPMINGIYIPANGSTLTGGVYVQGDASQVTMAVDGNSHQVYTVKQGSTTKVLTVNPVNATTSVTTNGGPATVYTGNPKGMVYVNGKILSLNGTIANETQVSIASTSDLLIDNHVKYQNYTASPLSAPDAHNLLGILSWTGNVRITTGAPNDLNIHGTVMAPNGVFTVDNYQSGSPRGTVSLLGGVITKNYGAFGTFSGTQQRSGYGRNFVYDSRMQAGQSPPYFPTISTYTATNTGVNNAPAFGKVEGHDAP